MGQIDERNGTICTKTVQEIQLNKYDRKKRTNYWRHSYQLNKNKQIKEEPIRITTNRKLKNSLQTIIPVFPMH